MKCSITDFFSKYDEIRSFLWICSHLLKTSVMKNFIVCSVYIAMRMQSATLKFNLPLHSFTEHSVCSTCICSPWTLLLQMLFPFERFLIHFRSQNPKLDHFDHPGCASAIKYKNIAHELCYYHNYIYRANIYLFKFANVVIKSLLALSIYLLARWEFQLKIKSAQLLPIN